MANAFDLDRVLPVVVAGILLLFAAPVGQAQQPDRPAKVDVFWIGHSLVNTDMPFQVWQLAQTAGLEHDYAQFIMPGAPLKLLWDQPERFNAIPVWREDAGRNVEVGIPAAKALPTGRFNVLVMTEAVPLEPQRTYNDTVGHAARFAQMALDANPDTRLILYETWTAVEADDWEGWARRITSDQNLWENTADEVSARLNDRPVRILPAGQAMLRLYRAFETDGAVGSLRSMRELFADDIHMNHAGNYFVACVAYATVHGRSPVGLGAVKAGPYVHDTVIRDEATREALQRIAWEAVQEYEPAGVD